MFHWIRCRAGFILEAWSKVKGRIDIHTSIKVHEGMSQSDFSVREAETFGRWGMFLVSTMIKGHVQVFQFWWKPAQPSFCCLRALWTDVSFVYVHNRIGKMLYSISKATGSSSLYIAISFIFNKTFLCCWVIATHSILEPSCVHMIFAALNIEYISNFVKVRRLSGPLF